ncbi:MAG: hypothetical protein ACI4W2_07775 [Eubacterium sp.]
MSSFFHYVNRTGYDHIYNSFSPAHIIIVIGFFLGFAWIARTSRKEGSGKLMRRLEKISLTVMAGGQVTYMIWFAVSGSGGDKWPLYACRMACILLIFTYFVRWMPLEQFSIYTALYGGISSVFYSTPKPFAFPHVTRIAFFATHIGLAYSALLRILNHDEEIDLRSLKGAESVNLAAIGLVLLIDIKFDWNYMFLLSPQLPTKYLGQIHSMYVQVLATIGVAAVYIFALAAAWVFAVWLQVHFSSRHYKRQSSRPQVRKTTEPRFVHRLEDRRDHSRKK